MSSIVSHPGVSLHSKVKGGTIQFMFRDSFDGGKQKKKSSKTNDWDEAGKLAEQLSEALRSQPDEIKDGYDKLVYDILEIQPFEKKLALAKDAVIKLPSTLYEQGSRASMEYYEKRVGAAENLLAQLEYMRNQREYWRARAIKAEAALGRKISDAEAKSGPRSLKKALGEFMQPKSGLKATGQSRYAVQKWIERFIRDFGEETDVNEIGVDQAIKHLEKFQAQRKLSDIFCYVTKFMTFATHGQFDRAAVKTWFDGIMNLRKEAVTDTELQKKVGTDKKNVGWFWLKTADDEPNALIEQVRKDAGDYWADAAIIQYGCGFRPEELPLLMTDAVKIEQGKARIVLVAPEGRRLKTSRSQDAVNVPTFAMTALKRRMKAAGATLFPLSKSGCELAPHLQGKRTGRDAELDLWPSADDHEWSCQYMARLTAAAEKVLPKQRADQVNSKTFRHTCGRELIVAHGFDKAAAVLRHDVNTLKTHYADLLTSDVSTER